MARADRSRPGRMLLWTVAGAAVGFGATYLLYVWLNPILEGRSDWLRELQGLLFNTVPLGTLVGSILGWLLGRKVTRSKSDMPATR